MTIKQVILKSLYPLIRKLSALQSKDSGKYINRYHRGAPVSFYSLHAMLANKMEFDFSQLQGKKVLLVNIASNCGFTPQYEALEKLSRMYGSSLTVLGFPANDFQGQEPGSDEEIEQFCKMNYGVSFPLFTKASVIKPGQQQVFEWLSSVDKNGWNGVEPSWNFCKYLVDEKGDLMAAFKSHVSPLDKALLTMVEQPPASGLSTTKS